jgi:hypothetical protein
VLRRSFATQHALAPLHLYSVHVSRYSLEPKCPEMQADMLALRMA